MHMHSEERPLRPFDPTAPATAWMHPDDYAQYDSNRNPIPRGLIYRFYDASRELLYVGQTTSTHTYPGRWVAHRRAPWWSLVNYYSVDRVSPDGDALDVLEKAAIRAERPRYNKQHAKTRTSFVVSTREGPKSVVEQIRQYMSFEDFAALAEAFTAETRTTQDL